MLPVAVGLLIIWIHWSNLVDVTDKEIESGLCNRNLAGVG